MMSLPVWLPGPMLLRGEVSLSGSLGGGSIQGGLCQGDPRTMKNGRYASYWNAFLFETLGSVQICFTIVRMYKWLAVCFLW